jgi:hypothetical protein
MNVLSRKRRTPGVTGKFGHSKRECFAFSEDSDFFSQAGPHGVDQVPAPGRWTLARLALILKTILIYHRAIPIRNVHVSLMPFPRVRSATWLAPVLFLGALALPGVSSAHSLLLNCRPAADNMVQCKGEFSDGSDAAGMAIAVKAYDERVLVKGTLGGDSTWRFTKPAGEYFVRLEDGGEHSAEVDHTDVKP